MNPEIVMLVCFTLAGFSLGFSCGIALNLKIGR